MYNNGLQDPELQRLHKKLGLNLNLFLPDILASDLFKVEDKGDYYHIYPLFYCDTITTDGDAFINDRYLIVCPKDYKQIFLFITDSSIIINAAYSLSNRSSNDWLLFLYDEFTFQPLRNHVFRVETNNTSYSFITDELGYCLFNVGTGNFEVIL